MISDYFSAPDTACEQCRQLSVLTELGGTHARDAFELTAEMLRILKSEVVGYPGHIIVGGEKTVFRQPHHIIVYEFFCIDAGLLLYKIAEISRGKIGFVCEIGHRREPFAAFTTLEILP